MNILNLSADELLRIAVPETDLEKALLRALEEIYAKLEYCEGALQDNGIFEY